MEIPFISKERNQTDMIEQEKTGNNSLPYIEWKW